MSRKFLHYLDSKTLDSVSNHYNIKNEYRHRAYGDMMAAVSIFERMIYGKDNLNTWKDFRQFRV